MSDPPEDAPASLQNLKNLVWALVLGLMVLVLVVSTARGRGPRDAAAAETDPPPGELTPVPMSVEPTGPTKPPTVFASVFNTAAPRSSLTRDEEKAIVTRARLELDKVTIYDATWAQTSSYPMGDVPENRGACTDVVVRSLREIGVDLQELVHDDIVRDMGAYGLTSIDANIDHRRVSTMFTFFQRNALSLNTDIRDKASFRPGDILFIAWQWSRLAMPEHAGIVSDRIGPRGFPLIIENGGPFPVERDSMGKGKIVGHFRALRKP
ncbi:MAG: DUF1287 domain-containing protein [Labilithrix sp.]|nr:DUF1287 domain-containing protein [Labilithrix sp.]